MRRALQLLLPAAALWLTACGPTAQQRADLATVQESGVPQAVYNKMAQGLILDVHDIKSLAAHRVPDDITLRYLRLKKTVYYLNVKDIESMRKGGVSDAVINYMLSTPELYPRVQYVNPYPYPYWDPGPSQVIIINKK